MRRCTALLLFAIAISVTTAAHAQSSPATDMTSTAPTPGYVEPPPEKPEPILDYWQFVGVCFVLGFIGLVIAINRSDRKARQSHDPFVRELADPPPLHAAMLGGAPLDKIRSLLDAGADVNAKMANGMTPLTFLLYTTALQIRQPGVVDAQYLDVAAAARLLLDRGADPDGGVTDGATPLRVAHDRDLREVEQMLIAAGATNPPPPLQPTDIDQLDRDMKASYDGFGPPPGSLRWRAGIEFARLIDRFATGKASENAKGLGCFVILASAVAAVLGVVYAIWWAIFVR
jgi:hypothetical protein